MPEFSRRSPPLTIAMLAAALISNAALAAPAPAVPASAASAAASTPAAAAEPLRNSAMDAPLFYQLLVGEMELRSGQPGVAFQVLLDAARRTGDDELFQRVINIALQARAGDQALIAAKAWRDAKPKSQAAHQMVMQLLALLNRPAEVPDVLRSLLEISPAEQRPGVLASLPRLFQRAAEPKQVLRALEPVLRTSAQRADTREIAQVVLGRFYLAAGETKRALELARELVKQTPESDDAMQLALDLMPNEADAEALVQARLSASPNNHLLRLAYGRALARSQRPAEAAREFRTVTEGSPNTGSAWFALGSLELELKHADAADKALREYLRLLGESPATAAETEGSITSEAHQQAWLMLAQAAEMRGDLKGAEAWLVKVDAPQRQLEAGYRRASLMARQGKLNEARKLLQALPESNQEELRAKLMAESQLLRDMQQWKAAHEVLERANERLPDDPDLIYEQSMMAEKLGRLDEMETLLKRVIAIKPDHHHAYNALGYSLAERNIRLPEARELIAKALGFVPSEPFILDSMGWVEYRLGNLPDSLRFLRQAYAARPDAEIAAHLGEVLWVSGEQAEAKRIWQEGIAREPKNEALRETLKRLKATP
ncbi:tetratricopeptide repeat protein [Paucibacter sp. AS339]|uniref:tetratricopeptide repeat protein n=1 Tax=Paucibacter hankyongi TaxID=3133434 RepID=UPI0030A0BA9C